MDTLREHLSKAGKVKTDKKSAACRENAAKARAAIPREKLAENLAKARAAKAAKAKARQEEA